MRPWRSPSIRVALCSVVAALAGGAIFPSAALAEPPPPAPPAEFPPDAIAPTAPDMPTDEAAWDIPDQFVVDLNDDVEDAEVVDLETQLGIDLQPTDLESETRIELLTIDAAKGPGVLRALLATGKVQHFEPLARVRAFFTADDPLLKEKQWHMMKIGAPRAWDFATGRGVTVAVVDTGIACEDHDAFKKGSDLRETDCVLGWNFVKNNEHANDDQGHGTHVAGTIAQSTNNNLGAAGVAFHASLMPVKVLNENGWGTTADVADGIRWAADNGAHVINLSLGGPRNSKILQDAVDHARSKGVIIVAAAGNSGGSVGFPGASEGVIGVSATDADDKIARFSSRGPEVDIGAPGVNVTQQTICGGGRKECENYPAYNGTSMASPHVAGVAALLVSQGVGDPAAVEARLKGSARVVDPSEDAKKLYGAGILDASAAVQGVSLTHAWLRLILVIGLSMLVGTWALRKNKQSASAASLSFVAGALAAGPGLLFFLPWILPRAYLPIDLLARPIGEMDLLVSASLHKYLPLANVLLPFGLTAIAFGSRFLRPVVAGISVGTAAYLVSIAILGEHAAPLGRVALIAWCGLNALGCAWLARENLAETRA